MSVSAAVAERLVLADYVSSDPEVQWEVTDVLEDSTHWAIAVNDARAKADPEYSIDGGLAMVSKDDGSLMFLGGMETGRALDNLTRVDR